MGNWRGHFTTITAHKLRVMKYCFKVGLYRQGLAHDLSKYTPVEFLAGVKYYAGTRSPIELEKMELGYSAGWLHHKGRNKHHLEYWIDYDYTQDGKMGGMRMPERYVVEMVCDRIAACQTYQKEKYTDASAWEYYEKSKANYIMHPETAALLEKLLLMLRDEGEEKTIAYIRREVLKNARRSDGKP